MFQQASFRLRQRRRGCSTSVTDGDSTSTWKVIQAFHHPLSLDYFIHFESVHFLDIPYCGAPNWLLFFILLHIYISEGAKKMYTHFKRCYLCITSRS